MKYFTGMSLSQARRIWQLERLYRRSKGFGTVCLVHTVLGSDTDRVLRAQGLVGWPLSVIRALARAKAASL